MTAVLQSSTATALLITGFASEGLVKLAPALAVMLGANLGTTLIVQVLSFNIALLIPGMFVTGIVLFRRAKPTIRDFGRVLIGVGIMLLALQEMTVFLGPLATDPHTSAIVEILAKHSISIVLLGALITWMVHSSVAVILLAMSMAASGALPVPAALAFVLGANLGTTISPLTIGLRSNDPTGRRLVVGNMVNRLVGVTFALLLFRYLPGLITGIEPRPSRAVADFHTGFNIVLGIVFLPFLSPFSRFLERWIPPGEDRTPATKPLYVTLSAPKTPSRVFGIAAREALRMADTLERMLKGFKDVLVQNDRDQIEALKLMDDNLDSLNSAIKEYLVAIDSSSISSEDEVGIQRVLTFSINIEQAGDIIDRNLLNIVRRRSKRGLSFSKEGAADLTAQVDRLLVNLHLAADILISGDSRTAHELAAEKEAFRKLEEESVAAHIERLRCGNIASSETSSLHLDILRDLKRVNAHLVEAAAYPILRSIGDLLPSRIRVVYPSAAVPLHS